MEARISSGLMAETAAEVEIARSEAVEAVAKAMEAMAEAQTAETEGVEEMPVEEIAPDPESAAGRESKPSPNWLERFLALH